MVPGLAGAAQRPEPLARPAAIPLPGARALSSAMALSAVLALAPVSPAALAGSTADEQPAIPNYQKVSAALQRGGQPSDNGLAQLKREGIKTIIDLRLHGAAQHHEEESAQKLGLNYVSLPMGYRAPPVATLVRFLEVVSDPANQPVFVHCRQGADRTGTLVAIYRMLVDGWSFEDTYQEMRQFHFKPWLISLKRSVAAVARSLSPDSSQDNRAASGLKAAVVRVLPPAAGARATDRSAGRSGHYVAEAAGTHGM